jgi:hypothetical protein
MNEKADHGQWVLTSSTCLGMIEQSAFALQLDRNTTVSLT